MMEVRPDDEGQIDEVVAQSLRSFHLEREDGDSWYLILECQGTHLHLKIERVGREVRVREHERYSYPLGAADQLGTPTE